MVAIEYVITFILTLVVYALALWLYKKSSMQILHPLLTSLVVIIVILSQLDISYDHFKTATMPIDFLLGPTVVALGWTLYKQLENLKKHIVSITISILLGAICGIAVVVIVARVAAADPLVELSLLSKSVTTPIALEITKKIGGLTSLCSVTVVLTGIFGSIIAPWLYKVTSIKDPIARGLALGCAAHGVGTAKAMELGKIEGAISALAIGLMGLSTLLFVDLFVYLCDKLS
ncbi:MAG: LrgB family protein [Rikenellaceae bacterium]